MEIYPLVINWGNGKSPIQRCIYRGSQLAMCWFPDGTYGTIVCRASFLCNPEVRPFFKPGLVISIGSIHSGETYRGFDIGGMGLLDVAILGVSIVDVVGFGFRINCLDLFGFRWSTVMIYSGSIVCLDQLFGSIGSHQLTIFDAPRHGFSLAQTERASLEARLDVLKAPATVHCNRCG